MQYYPSNNIYSVWFVLSNCDHFINQSSLTWPIYTYSSGLLHSLWGNCMISPRASELILIHDNVRTQKHIPNHGSFGRGHQWWPVNSPQTWQVLQRFDVFFVISANKLWSNQVSCQWFQMPWHSCDVIVIGYGEIIQWPWNTPESSGYFPPRWHKLLCIWYWRPRWQ